MSDGESAVEPMVVRKDWKDGVLKRRRKDVIQK